MQYGLLGGKLGHSLSPKIHELFFKYTGVTGTYELLETELEALPARVEAMRSTFAGSNVTIPHKMLWNLDWLSLLSSYYPNL